MCFTKKSKKNIEEIFWKLKSSRDSICRFFIILGCLRKNCPRCGRTILGHNRGNKHKQIIAVLAGQCRRHRNTSNGNNLDTSLNFY